MSSCPIVHEPQCLYCDLKRLRDQLCIARREIYGLRDQAVVRGGELDRVKGDLIMAHADIRYLRTMVDMLTAKASHA